jgi:hypothetical protein
VNLDRINTPIPVATEPPTEPATPPHPMDKVREQRDNARRDELVKDRRAKALELAAALYSVPASEGLILPVNVFDLSDELLTYIETGERPA